WMKGASPTHGRLRGRRRGRMLEPDGHRSVNVTRLKSGAVLILLGIGGPSCGDQPRAGAAPETSGTARAPAGRGKVSILIYYDMEGVSGQEDWRTASYAHQDQYRLGRELLTADVNA